MFHKTYFLTALALCLSVAAAAQASITGTVTGPDGQPLPGANLLLSPGDKGDASGPDGRFRIEAVSPGDYELTVSFLGYETQRQQVQLRQGQDKLELDFRLQARTFMAEALTVKATRAGATTPMAYLNVDETDLAPLNQGQDLPFLLRWTPSVVATSDAGAGIGYTGIRIRGSDPTRINVTVNGIPINDAESQGVFWVNMPDFGSSASDIQIQRGVGTSTNGAGAFGATININTTKLRPEPYANINASVGSFNTQRGNIEFGSGLLNGKFTLDGRLSRITSDGYIDRARSDLSSYYLSAAYLGERSSLRLVAFSGQERTYQAWYGVPKAFLADDELRTFNPAGTEKEGDPYEDEVDDYGQDHYQLIYNRQFTPNLSLNGALHYTKGAGYFEQYKADERLSSYGLPAVELGGEEISRTNLIRRRWLDNDFYGGVYALNYISNDQRLDATLGGSYHRYLGDHFGEIIWAQFASTSEKGRRYYDNDAAKSDVNVYSRFHYEFWRGLTAYLDLQYRRVDYEFLGFDQDGTNVTQTASLDFFNPKAGLFYKIDNRSQTFASFAVANREPNRNDYVESTPESRPLPERLYDTELGYEYRWDKAALQLNAYYMYYRDQLVLNGEVNDVGAYTRVNVDRSYRLGLEVTGGADLGSGFSLDGNFTISRNRVAGFTEFVDVYDEGFAYLGQEAVVHEETDLSFSPDLIAAAGLSYELLRNRPAAALHLNLQGKYVGQQYIDNSADPDNALDPYTFSDLRLRYVWQPPFARELSLTLLVQNVFDARYETNAWSYRYVFDGATVLDQGFFPQAGRNFLLGLSVGL